VDVEGSVKWFDPRKGFGFIVGPDGQDIFVHFSCIEGDGFRVLKDGAPVVYDAEESGKGWKATRVLQRDPTIVVPPAQQHTRTSRR
jgi:CspA family cold shock protein